MNYWGVVVFFSCLIAYFISDLFMSIYDMAIDTIFICWAEDGEMNNGSVSFKPAGLSDTSDLVWQLLTPSISNH